MVEYNKVNVKLSDSQSKLKSTVKNQTGETLRLNIKVFEGNNLAHELSLTTRQKTWEIKKCIWKQCVNWYKVL